MHFQRSEWHKVKELRDHDKRLKTFHNFNKHGVLLKSNNPNSQFVPLESTRDKISPPSIESNESRKSHSVNRVSA